MAKNSSLKGFLPATTFAMAVRKSFAPQSATTLFGRGNPNPELLFVGESFDEAQTTLLNKMIEAMGVKVSDVFVAEVHAQATLSAEVFESFHPKLIVSLGEKVTQAFLGSQKALVEYRGKIIFWQGYSLLPTYSPDTLLKIPTTKKEAWEDLKIAMRHLAWKK